MGDTRCYLGIPFSLTPKRSHMFHLRLQKISKKLSSWHDHYLSKAIRIVMIKYVLHSIHVHVMHVLYKTPQTDLLSFYQKVWKFFWSGLSNDNKLYLVNWEKLCLTKKKEWLGFRSLHQFNQTLITKKRLAYSYQSPISTSQTLQGFILSWKIFLRCQTWKISILRLAQSALGERSPKSRSWLETRLWRKHQLRTNN